MAPADHEGGSGAGDAVRPLGFHHRGTEKTVLGNVPRTSFLLQIFWVRDILAAVQSEAESKRA